MRRRRRPRLRVGPPVFSKGYGGVAAAQIYFFDPLCISLEYSLGQECCEIDKALMPRLRGQPCAITIVRPSVQPGQLLAAARRAVAEGCADMTGANRLPAQPTTRGLRCQCVPTPVEAARWASKLHLFCHDSPLRACYRMQIRLWGLAFDAGGLYWCSNEPAAESGERHMGNVGVSSWKGIAPWCSTRCPLFCCCW